MHNIVNNLNIIETNQTFLAGENLSIPKIIAVSKTFSINKVMPLVNTDMFIMVKIKYKKHEKWTEVKEKFRYWATYAW